MNASWRPQFIMQRRAANRGKLQYPWRLQNSVILDYWRWLKIMGEQQLIYTDTVLSLVIHLKDQIQIQF
jgi:hypothetical protein